MLQKIAIGTNGLYFKASPSEVEADLIYRHIQTIGKKELQEKEISEREDHYQDFLLVALVFLILEVFIGERKQTQKN